MRFLSPRNLILGATATILVYFSTLPLLLLLWKSVTPGGRISLAPYGQILSQPANLQALWNTLLVSGGTVVLAAILGVPLGWLFSRTDLPGRGHFRSLFALPYVVPPFIGAIAWIQLLNPQVGYINTWLRTGLGLSASPINIYGMGGMIWVMGLFYYPFVFLATTTALDNMDASLEEAARLSGARTSQVLLNITLPLIRPAILAGAFLVFVASAAAFGVPAMVGMPGRVFVLTTRIYSAISLGSPEGLNQAVALSVWLMVVAALALGLNTLLLRRRYTLVTGKSARPALIPLGRWRWPAFAGVTALFALIAVLPLVTILLTSLMHSWSAGLALSNLSLAHYGVLLSGRSLVGRALLNSLLLGTVGATLAVLLGTVLAYITTKTRWPGRHLLDSLAALPYATPGTVLALALIVGFSGALGLKLYNSLGILLAAYLVKYLSFAVRTIGAGLEQVHDSLEEAARTAGAGWLTAMTTILIPILKPSLIAAWFLIFMPTFSELTMSVLLVGPDTQTVGTVLFELQTYEDPPSAAVLSVIILAAILGSNALVKVVTKGKYGF